MRWTEIEDKARTRGITPPTYRQMDLWTRAGKLPFTFEGDRHGRFRDWPDEAVEVAFVVARLVSAGLDQELAWELAQTAPGEDGARSLVIDSTKPAVRLTVAVL